MAREVMERDELEAPYVRPYAVLVPRALRAARADEVLAVGTAGAVGGAVASIWLGPTILVLGLLVLAAALAVAGWLAGTAVKHVFLLSRTWDHPHELEAVRAARPHAHDADPGLAHDEFAATVEDDGLIFLWRFRALPVWEQAPTSGVLVPGRPQHVAEVEHELPLDPRDQVHAAEQLAAAQEQAATLEAEAIEAARRGIAERAERAEIAAEAASTAAALQHLTGQRTDRR